MPSVEQPQPNKTIGEILAGQSTPVAPHEIEHRSKLELLKKVRVVRERMLSHNSSLSGTNPAKQYCWVNIKEDRQTYYQAIGWNQVTDPKVSSPFKQPDGTHRRADVTLYEIDKDYYEAIVADNQIRGLEGIDGAREGFQAAAARQGVPTHTPQV